MDCTCLLIFVTGHKAKTKTFPNISHVHNFICLAKK